MPEFPIGELKDVIRSLHSCDSAWVESVAVHETFEGDIVWDGTVQVFDLLDHPQATRCYVWSYPVDEFGRRRFAAVLHQGPVDSPQAAVRAAIAQE